MSDNNRLFLIHCRGTTPSTGAPSPQLSTPSTKNSDSRPRKEIYISIGIPVVEHNETTSFIWTVVSSWSDLFGAVAGNGCWCLTYPLALITICTPPPQTHRSSNPSLFSACSARAPYSRSIPINCFLYKVKCLRVTCRVSSPLLIKTHKRSFYVVWYFVRRMQG